MLHFVPPERTYLKLHNPHMRELNAHWASDWDPKTNLMYVVRDAHPCVDQTVAPFGSANYRSADEDCCGKLVRFSQHRLLEEAFAHFKLT